MAARRASTARRSAGSAYPVFPGFFWQFLFGNALVRAPHLHLPHFHLPLQFRDRPLAGEPAPERPFHFKLYICESLATAILMIFGISSVTLLTAPGSPVADVLRAWPHLQIALCGLFFGLSGSIAAYSPFGKVSGAHINPSVTLAFLLAGKLVWLDALGYFVAQIMGAIEGTLLVSLFGDAVGIWGHWAEEASFAATIPNPSVSVLLPLFSEFFVTALLIGMLYWLASHKEMRWLTPWAGGLFFLVMNPLTAWLSGNSVNLARSFAPAVFSAQWSDFWIYVIGPFGGSALAVFSIKSQIFGRIHLPEARLINFGHRGRVPSLANPEASL